jgi:hypothetical protein
MRSLLTVHRRHMERSLNMPEHMDTNMPGHMVVLRGCMMDCMLGCMTGCTINTLAKMVRVLILSTCD